MQRSSGIRQFGEQEIETLRIIDCLKKSGLEIKEIKQFMQWCALGPQTYAERKAFFEHQKTTVEKEISKLEKVLDMIRFKCWYYERAMQDGNEDTIHAMLPNHLPEDIQHIYDHAHED